jgi:hypothetical protein
MKRMMLISLLVAMSVGLFAQDYVPTKEAIGRFAKTKTLVVLEDNPLSDFNMTLKQVMPEEWTMTPYDFISWKEFETKRMDSKFSFIILDQVKFDKDKTNAKYNFMSLVMGGAALTINTMPDLCSIPLSYYGIGDDTYSYKLGILIRFMQNHVKLLQDDPKIASENILRHYNDNIQLLQGKTLYFVANELAKDVNTLAKIKKIYPGPVKLVTQEEIKQAISDKLDVVFLHKVGPESTKFKSRCYKILIGAADAKFYYFDYHMVTDDDPDGFLAKDLKKLAKKQ